MRLLTTFVMALAASPALAADKDEDKAKEVAVAFLKAVKAKDLDAVMKTVSAPFLFPDANAATGKLDDVNAKMKELLTEIDPEKIPTEVGMVIDVPALAKKATTDKEKRIAAFVEKLTGKAGYVVHFNIPRPKRTAPIIVRITDGKATVAGIID